MKTPEKRCGNCTYWMTQQCPREAAGGKPSMNSHPCSSFLMQWSEAKRFPQPQPFEPRGKNAPMVSWGEPEIRDTDGFVSITARSVIGTCPNISSYWNGWRYGGFKAYGLRGVWATIDEAKIAINDEIRRMAEAKVAELVGELQVAMYHAGIQHLSVSQMAKPMLAAAPNEMQNEEELP